MMNDVFSNGRLFRRVISVHNIYGVDRYSPTRDQSVRVGYPAFSLVYCDKDEVSLEIRGEKLRIPEGYCAFVSPNVEYVLSTSAKDARIFYAVFSVKENSISLFCEKTFKVSRFGKSLLAKTATLASELFEPTSIRSLARLPEQKQDVGAFVEQTARGTLELFVIDCIKPSYKSINNEIYDNETSSESQRVTADIYSFLSQNVQKRISLNDVAEALFFSKSYVKTAFKKETGKSIMEAFNDLKIDEAKKMIENGLSMAEISDQLSFCNKNYFSTLFKSKCGMTPIEYKKSLGL